MPVKSAAPAAEESGDAVRPRTPVPPVRRLAPRPARRLLACAVLLGTALAATGCHNLQEHRRARWNYGPGMSSGSDPYSLLWDHASFEGLT